ncbi:phytoene/squalene synthase family protein [Nonomuraea jiangxiensis]|uniref:Phytoene synthase n=1 Tax=Nonomuraea jiangxiensis TaxID=633440 RepID=A0A1G9JRD3_9ACTN|nr:phytoene/squalene synthase family protein [Nonomuraea jiangxiensis]SDL40108.1 phytoene synthase [Nonomuraea jiangxiensis]
MTLTASYERCRRLHARYGRSYYLATRLLPRWKRRHVHALYGFARYADEIVDSFTMTADRSRALAVLSARVEAGLAGQRADDPVLPAFLHTVHSFGIDHGDVGAFLASMRADLSVTRYPTYDDLLGYMAGSAAAIGTMMLPVLEPAPGREEAARRPARELGLAFQLTNFLRDVGEDFARGRVYLPLEDLEKFGVDPDELGARRTGSALRELLAFEAGRARDHYRVAAGGIGLLVASSRPCVRAAFDLYGGILDEIENRGFEVLAGRVRVPRHRKAAVFARHLLASAAAGRAERRVRVELP